VVRAYAKRPRTFERVTEDFLASGVSAARAGASGRSKSGTAGLERLENPMFRSRRTARLIALNATAVLALGIGAGVAHADPIPVNELIVPPVITIPKPPDTIQVNPCLINPNLCRPPITIPNVPPTVPPNKTPDPTTPPTTQPSDPTPPPTTSTGSDGNVMPTAPAAPVVHASPTFTG
jgi:hypothetical protein